MLYQLSYPRWIKSGGEGRIRTSEGIRRQIYSLFPLAAREPLRFSLIKKMVPMVGIEPTTARLQVECSTVEPHRHQSYAKKISLDNLSTKNITIYSSFYDQKKSWNCQKKYCLLYVKFLLK